ncbi:retrovirus-related Pol polyprotein from transposon TNT 1-94 [Trichonephila clavipes]|nr:retrovirus-related Pol polyprotein from transposon TNT 1-94 [Trichonephila clavipes]
MGKTKKLLGTEFEEQSNSLFIHQRSYIRRLCVIYEKYKNRVSSLPISKGQVLSKLDSPKNSEEILTAPYRNLIGSLSFIAIPHASPGLPIGVTVHYTQQPIREQSLSSQPSRKLFQTHHPDEAPKPRLPNPIDHPIAVMPPRRM